MTKVVVGLLVLAIVLGIRAEWLRRGLARDALLFEARATKALAMAEDAALREAVAAARIGLLVLEGDSLRKNAAAQTRVVRTIRDTLVVLPPAPDTCRVYADRIATLDDLLNLQGQATATAMLASARSDSAAREALGLVEAGRVTRDSLRAALEARPRPARKAKLEALGIVEADPNGFTGTVALRSGKVYAGSRWRPVDGRVEQSWVVGIQQPIRLW